MIELVSTGYSPVATAALCARQGGGTVCAETIYQGIYGGSLGLKATDCLRSRRPRRKKRRAATSPRTSALGPNAVPISERPAEAAEGASGHWEGDLIIGARNQSAALTLVERVVRQLVGTTLGVLRHLVWTTFAPAERDHLVGGLPGPVS